ncbi:hypothetical protein SB751_32725, partial [Cupriavidus sp. SIMBA_020]|uniref:hypothetical protein n=1 Tax=Cupriavidus sp. SIMBA_020 TaxID=3085766 RepID=UPI00397AC441
GRLYMLLHDVTQCRVQLHCLAAARPALGGGFIPVLPSLKTGQYAGHCRHVHKTSTQSKLW